MSAVVLVTGIMAAGKRPQPRRSSSAYAPGVASGRGARTTTYRGRVLTRRVYAASSGPSTTSWTTAVKPVVAARGAGRGKSGYGGGRTPERPDRGLREETARIGLWLDTSELTVEATVDAILADPDRALVP
ncbi:hypothetical protein ACPB9J_05465 [Streptomyces lavendulocolor]|uniref:hypothetical protein n=1 Tax=Streptomyces lavendulocolor TaxID=67316 RepID=UPI003C2E4185